MCRQPFSGLSKKGAIVYPYHFGRIILSCTFSKELSTLRFFQAYAGSYFNWHTPEYVFNSTAVGKAPKVCMEASGWKYKFFTGNWVSRTHSLMGWRVYRANVIFSNFQENYMVAANLLSLLWKEFFPFFDFTEWKSWIM